MKKRYILFSIILIVLVALFGCTPYEYETMPLDFISQVLKDDYISKEPVVVKLQSYTWAPIKKYIYTADGFDISYGIYPGARGGNTKIFRRDLNIALYDKSDYDLYKYTFLSCDSINISSSKVVGVIEGGSGYVSIVKDKKENSINLFFECYGMGACSSGSVIALMDYVEDTYEDCSSDILLEESIEYSIK